MTEEMLNGIEERAAAATPGPWVWRPCLEGPDSLHRQRDDGTMIEIGPWRSDFEPHDAAFIAHARIDVPDLVAEVRKLRAILTELVDLKEIRDSEEYWREDENPHGYVCRKPRAWEAAREALGREPQ